MNIIKNQFIGILALVILGVYAFLGGSTEVVSLGGTTNYDDLEVSTISVTGASTISGATTFSGALTATGATDVGIFTSGGGCTASSTTVAAETWTEAFMLSSNCFTYSGTAAAAAITITLPATSTMTTLLPSAGDSRTWFYDPDAYAAATTTTFAAGAGVILYEVGDGDATNVIIAGGTSAAKLDCTRLANTDVACIVTEISDAD